MEVPTAGRYILDFRYANGSRNARPLRITLDGLQHYGHEPFEPTGSWSTWRTVSQLYFLSPGVHTVRLSSIGSSGANLDSLTARPAV